MLILGISASGCSSHRLNLPEYDTPTRLPITATLPAELPPLPPKMTVVMYQGNKVVIFTVDEAAQINLFRQVADANQVVAKETAAELIETKQAFNALADAMDSEKVMMQMLADSLVDERQARRLDAWYYKALIGGGLIAVAVFR